MKHRCAWFVKTKAEYEYHTECDAGYKRIHGDSDDLRTQARVKVSEARRMGNKKKMARVLNHHLQYCKECS